MAEGGIWMVSASPAGIQETNLMDQRLKLQPAEASAQISAFSQLITNCLHGRIPGLLNGFEILQIYNLK